MQQNLILKLDTLEKTKPETFPDTKNISLFGYVRVKKNLSS